MKFFLASLLLTQVISASLVSAASPTHIFFDGLHDGDADRIYSEFDNGRRLYRRSDGGVIRVAAGFTIEEHEISSDELLLENEVNPATGRKTPTLDLTKMGPCCPAGSAWKSATAFCQHSVWKDRNDNDKLEPEEQIIQLYEKGQRDPNTGECKVGPILGASGQSQQQRREQSQTGNRKKPESQTQTQQSGTVSSPGSSAAPSGSIFDCELGLQSMGVTAINQVDSRMNRPRMSKIQHMPDGRASFSCWYQITGIEDGILVGVGWLESPYQQGRYTFGKNNCGQGLYRFNMPVDRPDILGGSSAYYRGVNGKAAYVRTNDGFIKLSASNGRWLDAIGVNRFKAMAEKILAQIAPRAVDCP
ncbi:MAG: hypothetical protein O2999_13745 [Nitrospirae bacterium]|nr:hypothetical protein [Nitrospirota bacterium]MDA1305331.1 hypothetical protein [Nitrospirota bacterium]